MLSLEKFQGCLIGGAIGDALGYPIEFFSHEMILEKYGNLVSRYIKTYGNAIISDDTQMTLFTASGILTAEESKKVGSLFQGYSKHIYDAYLDWYNTQYKTTEDYDYTSWLYEIDNLHELRYPGTTCTSSLRKENMGSIKNRINNSSGCGGVMRVAPIGLYFKEDIDKVFLLGCESAALTHGNNNAIIPAGVVAAIINEIIYTNKDLEQIVKDSIRLIKKYFKGEDVNKLVSLLNRAINYSKRNLDDVGLIEALGAGWHGDEALAISLYCVLKYRNDFEKAMIAAVNHSGDSDSTGAITGNILGSLYGYSNLPKYYLDDLELHDEIIKIADDLYGINDDLDKRYLLKR